MNRFIPHNVENVKDRNKKEDKSENSDENDSMKTGKLMEEDSDEKDDLEEEEEDFDDNEEDTETLKEENMEEHSDYKEEVTEKNKNFMYMFTLPFSLSENIINNFFIKITFYFILYIYIIMGKEILFPICSPFYMVQYVNVAPYRITEILQESIMFMGILLVLYIILLFVVYCYITRKTKYLQGLLGLAALTLCFLYYFGIMYFWLRIPLQILMIAIILKGIKKIYDYEIIFDRNYNITRYTRDLQKKYSFL